MDCLRRDSCCCSRGGSRTQLRTKALGENEGKETMITETALLILSLLVHMSSNGKETTAEAQARLWPMALEITQQSETPDEAAMLISQGRGESRFDRDVMWLTCRPGKCDPISGTKLHRAKGPFQNHRINDVQRWAELWDSIQGQADVAQMVELQLCMQRMYVRMCGGDYTEAFGAHGGKGCRVTEQSKLRERLRRSYAAKIRQVWWQR